MTFVFTARAATPFGGLAITVGSVDDTVTSCGVSDDNWEIVPSSAT